MNASTQTKILDRLIERTVTVQINNHQKLLILSVLKKMIKQYGSPEVFFLRKRAQYNPITNKITCYDIRSLIAELAHAKQRNVGKNSKIKFFFRGIIDWWKNKYFNQDQYDSTQYDQKGSIENEAHSIIELEISSQFSSQMKKMKIYYDFNLKSE